MELIGIIAWGVLLLIIGSWILLDYQEKKNKARLNVWQKKFMAGKPTHRGKLMNVEYSAGGYMTPNITTIMLDNRVILVGGYVEPLVIGKRYKFWVTRSKRVLKFEEECE